MSLFRLSNAAVQDIQEIRAYTREHFGPEQAARFRKRLQKSLQALARTPLSAPLRSRYDPEGRTFRYFPFLGTFIIVYRPVANGIHVARLLHGARDLARELEREDGDE